MDEWQDWPGYEGRIQHNREFELRVRWGDDIEWSPVTPDFLWSLENGMVRHPALPDVPSRYERIAQRG